jgi:signal transduction histidine kinase
VPYRPPPLITALLTTTAVVSGVLAWSGWRLLVQQRAIDEQRARGSVESAAEAIGARASGRLADAGDRLSTWVSDPSERPPAIEGATVLAITDERVAVVPDGGLPFVPLLTETPLDPPDVFTEAEALELRAHRVSQAAEKYRALAAHPVPHVGAEALVRLGALLRRAGDLGGALGVYGRLAAMRGVRTSRLPSELTGLYGQRAVLRALGDRAGEARLGKELVQALDAGRWPLLRGPAEFYRDDFGDVPRPGSWGLAAALDDVWRESGGTMSSRGQRVFEGKPSAILVLWRSNGTRSALLATFADAFFRPIASDSLDWRLADPGGRLLSGAPSVPQHAVTRVIGTSDYPMTLNVWSLTPTQGAGRERLVVLSMTAVMLLFLWTATYFIVRAIRREAGVARLQSDFVAAVSHEFRSPLTTVRQMAEMLEMGRITNEERRQSYYRMLASEAARLQHLVETLLNFGRLEAGAERYRLTDVRLAPFVDTLVQGIRPQLEESGKQIEVSGPPEAVVRADEAAFALALRNLIDNAVKYSPDQPTICDGSTKGIVWRFRWSTAASAFRAPSTKQSFASSCAAAPRSPPASAARAWGCR